MKDHQERTVQEYIDETPLWRNGVKLAEAPMTRMQWFIWSLATAGKLFEGLVVFATGVAIPLVVKQFGLGEFEKGLLGASTLAGILVGATVLGGLADHFGRKTLFIAEMAIFTVFLTCASLSPSFEILVVSLFGMGLALGCDYPVAHVVISESIPSSARGRLVLGAFGFQAIGAMVGTLIGFLVLRIDGQIHDWRLIYGTAILPAACVTIARCFITQSPHWLVTQGRIKEAERETSRLLRRVPPYPTEVHLKAPAGEEHAKGSSKSPYHKLFSKKHRRATILASIPWFLQDLSTYGIGIFTPVILAAAIGAGNAENNVASIIHHQMDAAKGAALIDMLLIAGIGAAVLLADRVGRIRLQILGFIGCAAGLALAGTSQLVSDSMSMALLFAGFMLFSFMTNMGPNSMTYLLAGEVFPTKIRSAGAGLAASFAKAGAVLVAFFFPVLLKDLGAHMLLFCLAVASLLGAVVTWCFAIETTGKNLETIGQEVPAKEAALA